MDGVSKGVEGETTIFLTAAQEERDIRIAFDQGFEGLEERKYCGTGLLVLHQAPGKPVELPKQSVPVIEQRQAHGDGRRCCRCPCLADGLLDMRPFRPCATREQGIELRLVMNHLPFVQKKALFRIQHLKRERASYVQKASYLQERN